MQTICRMHRSSKVVSALLTGALIAAIWAAPVVADEFVGPFTSWKNCKADYGAVGDGKADDTAAVQKAFDDLQLHKEACVVYFPAGIYRITKTVMTTRTAHQECMGVTVIGEDPATTTILWDGPEGGMMVKYDAWYSRISRLTLDGAGKAGVALAYGDRFSTYNETSDMVFKDVAVGMSMATGAHGQAENEVVRCRFLRCSRAGLQTNNYNSLDIWAWYCLFEDCGYGLYNGAGNFHVHQCVFLRSKVMDIGTANLMAFSFVNNHSIGSRCFMDWQGGHSWGSPCSITGNRIIEPTGDFAIRLGNGGPYLVMDNVIKSRPGVSGPAAIMTWGSQTFVGNTYTVKDPVKEAGRFRRIAEKVVDAATIQVVPPELPPTPPKRDRKVFDLPATADAAAIQKAIDAAAALKGQRPVVHLPMGIYKIDRTLLIPAGTDVQIIGDGGAETATVLRWSGPIEAPIFLLKGPSKATLKDLSLAAGRGRGIVVEDCDQPGGRIFADQLNVSGISNNENGTGLLVNGVEQSDVLVRCAQGGTFCDKWINVLGGPLRQAGREAPGQVSILTGATGTADAQYNVAKGGQLVVRAVYHEVSGESLQGILLDNSGLLTVDTTRFSYRTSADKPLVELRDFVGNFVLTSSMLLPVGTAYPERIDMQGDGARCNVLCVSNMFWANMKDITSDMVWSNNAKPPANGAMLNCNLNGGSASGLKGGFGYLEDRGEASDEFILKMLQPLRQCRVWVPEHTTPPGVTDVRLYRVIGAAGKGGVCVELLRSQTGT